MFSSMTWVKSKLLRHNPVFKDKITEFHIISNWQCGGALTEDAIPWAIVLDEVHAPELSQERQQADTSREWELPAPVFFALSFLLALAVFCSAD